MKWPPVNEDPLCRAGQLVAGVEAAHGIEVAAGGAAAVVRVLGEDHHLSDAFSGMWGTWNTCGAKWVNPSCALFTLKHQKYSVDDFT